MDFGISDPPDDTLDAPILAICTDMSRCGGAVYLGSKLELVADRKDSADPYKGLDILIQRVNPERVIVSSVQKKLIYFLEKRFNFRVHDISKSYSSKKRRARLGHPDPSAEPQEELTQNLPVADQTGTNDILNLVQEATNESSFTLVIVPNYWFSVTKGLQKLIDSELVARKGYTDAEEKSLFIASKVEKSVDVCAIRAISAIDQFILNSLDIKIPSNRTMAISSQIGTAQRETSATQSSCRSDEENPSNHMPIFSVGYIDPGPVLSLDKFSFESLSIFHQFQLSSRVVHDSEARAESLPSLYDLLNQCCSVQGRRQLHTIMLWPLQDPVELQNRYDAIEFLMTLDNQSITENLKVNLRSIVPLSFTLTRLSQSVAQYKDLAALYRSILSFTMIMDTIKSCEFHRIAIFCRIKNLDSQELRDAVDRIVEIVDFEGSKRERNVQVCDGVDRDVDEKKAMVSNLNKLCNDAAVQETTKYKETLAKMCRVIYIPRIGFLNAVDYSTTSELLSIRSNPEFDVLLHTEQSVYFKTPRMNHLDRNAGDVACDLIDVQQNVLVNLQNSLLKISDVILALVELCGELDCLLAFASVSSQRGFMRPELVESPEELNIRQAYHPLLSTITNMVPNDVTFYRESSGRHTRVMIITGPNSCGKTTYMKTMCLIVYMAQIGCFVPAIEAKIPIFDAILTRLNPANSISTGLSSFATDLHQVSYAINKATARSLIAVDEFGKGTQARDGFHLLKGLVIYFALRRQESPFVMITSHFNRIVDHLLNQGEFIMYKTFKVSRNVVKDTVVYEYSVMEGVGELTLADEVAIQAGVPQYIIERAQQIRDHISENRPIGPRPPNAA